MRNVAVRPGNTVVGMTLSLIWGPSNAGRVGEVLNGFREALPRDPVLVVPNADDAELFESELTSAGALLGGSVVTFGGLVGEVARSVELPWGAGATRPQAVWLAREASRRVELRTLRRSAERVGFAPALADLLSELQAAGIDASTMAEMAVDHGDYERELAALFAARDGLQASLGISDHHALMRAVTAELRSNGEAAWAGRPVFVYGFDELTVEQLAIVGALAEVAPVTVAVTYEDRDALAARAKLLGDLRALVPAEKLGSEVPLEADPAFTDPVLWHIERGFLDPGAERIEPTESLVLMRASGERAEAEQVGSRVARLLADGAEPEQVAIVLRSPASSGALWMEVLARLGIPAAVEASAPLTTTAVGRAMLALARLAGPDGTAEDLVRYLRAPGRAPSGQVDRLERTIRRKGMRTASEAEAAWAGEEKTRELFELPELRGAEPGAPSLRTTARLARMIAEHPIADGAEIPGPLRSLELRAAAECERALLEVAELEPAAAGPAEVEEILGEVRVRLHQGAVRGRVRVVSPYRLRARRVKHLLVASLQDSEFPRRDPGSPLLGDERRASMGIPERSPAEQEERYLFAVCLSRPEETLTLSWKQTDDEGRASARSPFVDEVRDLLSPPQPDDPEEPDELMERIGRERGPADVVPSAAEASTPAELARAVAVTGRDGWRAALEHVDANGAAESVEAALAEADLTTAEERVKPRDLHGPAVLEALKAVDLFGASTLENYETCSYRWLVGHELKPQRLDPADEPLVLGGLAHKALEELYRNPPDGGSRPTPETLSAWRKRSAELVTRIAAESDLPASDPMALAQARRVEGLIAAHLADEAAADRVLAPDPLLLEADFGEGKDKGPLELDGVRLHGQIDRVDVGDGPAGLVGLVTDYKLSSKVTTAAGLSEEGKLQLQLYSLALRELWGIEPLGGVYLPLRGTDKRMGRGLLRGEMKELLEGYDFVSTDLLPDEEFDAALDDAKAAAERIADRIRSGRVRRDPQGGECPRYCRWQTICRKERGMEEKDDEEELDA